MVVDEVTVLVPNRTQGYEFVDGELRNSTLMDSSYKIPGGGLASTVVDLAKFAIAMQNGTLLKPGTTAQMWTSTGLRDGSTVPYGLGWRVDKWKGLRVIDHGEAQQITSTLLYILPDKGIAVAIMDNLEHSPLRELAQQIAEIVER